MCGIVAADPEINVPIQADDLLVSHYFAMSYTSAWLTPVSIWEHSAQVIHTMYGFICGVCYILKLYFYSQASYPHVR